MPGLAIFIAILIWLAVFGRRNIAKWADSMATMERDMRRSPKRTSALLWSTSYEWLVHQKCYKNITEDELDAEIVADLQHMIDLKKEEE